MVTSARTDVDQPRRLRPHLDLRFCQKHRLVTRKLLDNLTCPFEARNTNPAMPAVHHAIARTRRHAHDATALDHHPLHQDYHDERNDAMSSPLPSPMLLPLCSIVTIVDLPVPRCSSVTL